jgi:hypothetical protein
MKRSSLSIAVLFVSIFFGSQTLEAQSINVHFVVSPELDTFPISPFIYGANAQGDDSTAGITAQRGGGNRWTGYNWETNASNAGTDYLNESDDYMTYTLPSNSQHLAAVVPWLFHKEAKRIGAYSVVTLPLAGYVAADISGVVTAAQVAPSTRWRQVRYAKGAPFKLAPDSTDGFVYVDEEVNFLTQSLGMSDTGGIRGYNCDNEPALWPSTHPRIHPTATTCAEVITKDSALALAVKAVDPHAEVFGPVSYGFAEYLNNQTAPDWANYSKYGRWIDAYLVKMKQAETASGKRLLDVLDLHWYPEAQGKSSTGQLTRITGSDVKDEGIARARMDAPRSLWDSSYTENSWIGQYYSPVALLPWLNASIAKNYPGTKLSFTEYDYGGEHQISGAIATADVLGIFGRYHVYMSNHWGTIDNFLASGFRIFRNYDGKYSAFGNISVTATTDKIDSTSIYAARRTADPNTLDIVAINKSSVATVYADIRVASANSYTSARAFMLQSDTTLIKESAPLASISNNEFSYTLPPLSVTHFVLARSAAGVSASGEVASWSIRSAVASANRITIHFDGTLLSQPEILVQDVLGRTLLTSTIQNPITTNGSITLSANHLPSGALFISVRTRAQTARYKLVVGSD